MARKTYTKKCKFCGKTYHPFRRKQVYCSRQCRGKDGTSYYRSGKFVRCAYCKKKIWRKNYLIKRFRRFFCDKTCQNKYKSEFGDYSWATGEKQWNWKGGISFLGKKLYKQIRKRRKYVLWRKAIFERDDYTCRHCKVRGGKLNADHYPKPFSIIVRENKLKTLKDMYNCKKLWDIDNGRTLCVNCHHDIGWRGSHLLKKNI